jgi:ribosomal protein S18 acetylase RimI-like enzyme
MSNLDPAVVEAEDAASVESVRTLFAEYAVSLGFSLCFQNFDQELAGLPGSYRRPDGRLLLARMGNADIGCVALRRIGPQTCEMKRLYVRPAMRAQGVGRYLAGAAITAAREIGYSAMRLDTVEPLMTQAVALYRQLGFRAIDPYTPNPVNGALYMELDLASRGPGPPS